MEPAGQQITAETLRPYRDLWITAIIVAVEDLTYRPCHKERLHSPEVRNVRKSARRWFANKHNREPYSFEWVCDELGLDADAVRSRILGDVRCLNLRG